MSSGKMLRLRFDIRLENTVKNLTYAGSVEFGSIGGLDATMLVKAINPYSMNILMASYDKEAGASLYYIDYIATLHNVDKGVFSYGSYFSLATMDIHYRSDMSVEEAIELVDKCILEIRSRLVVAPPTELASTLGVCLYKT
ncbi:unnamed protein product [Thlaspi arvense]|uniref:Uncharacterized protein n=1 Tax=Thlaspi arvense TaxID=13288 RepID=A0AAU9SMR1_THLAR|nr:unnamed protein product [Thlaspi arvense]